MGSTNPTTNTPRPLFMVYGKGSSANSFVALRAHLPSEKARAYRCLCHAAMPRLLGPCVLLKAQGFILF
jgi:hypothetical protein